MRWIWWGCIGDGVGRGDAGVGIGIVITRADRRGRVRTGTEEAKQRERRSMILLEDSNPYPKAQKLSLKEGVEEMDGVTAWCYEWR